MERNFHYYVTYTAAAMAGFSPDDALAIARAAQYVDECEGLSVQSEIPLVWENFTDTFTSGSEQVRKILEIWPVFHFLPGDYGKIAADVESKLSTSTNPLLSLAPQLICGTESAMTKEIVEGAKACYDDTVADAESKLLRIGITMHVLADTFAHQGFAGIPLRYVNEVAGVMHFVPEKTASGEEILKKKSYRPLEYSPAFSASSFGFLGHGRIGHLPDQPGEVFHYQAAWRSPVGDAYVTRYNPLEFYCAYLQMLEAMEYILGQRQTFGNSVDRGTLVDQRKPLWETVTCFLEAFAHAGEDKKLKEPWFALFAPIKIPADYKVFDKKREVDTLQKFRDAAKDHRSLVMEKCGPLRSYRDTLLQS